MKRLELLLGNHLWTPPVFYTEVLLGLSPSGFGVEQSGYNTADCFIL